MSYQKRLQCEIVPKESYKIIRNCPGCKDKMKYKNTGCFRVNANGNKVDIWLIYQCEKCKRTYNLSIHERIKPFSILPSIYKRFLDNDMELALKYGTDKQLFARNKAEIDWNNVSYSINIIQGEVSKELTYIEINNPYEIKLRTDKIVAELLSKTRNEVKLLLENNKLEFSQTYLLRTNTIWINQEI